MHVARVLLIGGVMSWYGRQGRLPDGMIMSCYVKVEEELTRQRVIQEEGTTYTMALW